MKILTKEKMIDFVLSRPVLKKPKRSRKKVLYLDAVCAFDIETSIVEDETLEDKNAVMYVWQFACEDKCCWGRTWDEYINFIGTINDHLHCNLVVYVHNLSYEFTWLSGLFDFASEDVFCTAPRKILTATWENIEYRCSMLLSNDSLEGFCDKHKVEHQKQSGIKFDYTKQRFYFTPLTLFEFKYALYDVVGLVECIKAEMKTESRDLYSIPLTSTGYVRQDVKIMLKDFNKTRQPFLQPQNIKIYQRLKEAFRGGNTHGNRYFGNTIIEEKGVCIDISSAYPFQMCTQKMPMSGWKETKPSLSNFRDLRLHGYNCLIVIQCFGIYLKDKYDGFPPLSKSKCRNVYKEVADNGRILSAVYLETTMTDIDLEIFLDHYDGEIVFQEMYYCRSELLPLELRKYIFQLYNDKTALKGLKGEFAEIRYMQAKNRLNAIYGLSVQDVLRALILYVNGVYTEDLSTTLEERLQKNVYRAYMSFSWGCWITAYTRKQLENGLRAFTESQNGFALYCDTDSVYGIGDFDLESLNAPYLYYSRKYGLSATDKNGKLHHMGLFEVDKEFDRIRFMGAKKYAYEKNGDLFITIAGVNKKKGREQLKNAGGLEALKEGFVFKAVNTNAIYNDDVNTSIVREGHVIPVTRNVALVESDYTMGLTGEYEYILTHPECFYDL